MKNILIAQGVIEHDLTLIEYVMPCYNTLDDPEFDQDRDDILHNRSAMELVRDQLSDNQILDLEEIDDYWRGNPELFNRAFAQQHATHDPRNDLLGYVSDAKGDVPAVPKSHWWWRPINPKVT
ncbi:MAG: hypothetical protein ACPG5U_00330 [Planktomarina sp.]